METGRLITVHLALGTNLGDRETNLRRAIESFAPSVVVLQESVIYETPPWGMIEQPAFLNMVVKGQTTLSPLQLLQFLKQLELNMGRLPGIRYGPRLIDLDILFYEDLVLEMEGLCIPHPRLHERAFVLVPLAEISPTLIHPVLVDSVQDLLSRVDTKGIIQYAGTDLPPPG
jgi:2-amino-4-hydroxy-6-hydroxymethyldihydropteridine diphosphokinase